MKTSQLIGLSRHRIGVDGAGVTTLVAFHGCPLNCKYCLNPQALSPHGVWKSFSPEALFREVKKDDLYFKATNGGVTFGGGEPLLHYEDILHFHSLCRDNGKKWKLNIETSLNVPGVFVDALDDVIEHWIVDIKDMNPDIYKSYTGRGNKWVIENLQHLVDRGSRITVRVPQIPNFNAAADIEQSIMTLHKMGVMDVEKFTYIIK